MPSTSFTLPRRALLAAAGSCLLLAGTGTVASAAPPADGDARSFIDALGQRTVGVLSRPGTDQAERTRGMTAILDEAVDVDLIARLVLGRHWRAASEAQRAEYVRLFRAYAIASLAERFSLYTGGERFSITGSRAAGDDDTLVGTTITYAGNQYPPLVVDWRVRQVGERLMIIDVVAAGVSLLVTNRSEFDSIVAQRGIDGLLADLRRRYAAGGARPAA